MIFKTKIIFILLLTNYTLLISVIEAQFQLTIGGPGDDYAWSVKQTVDGSYVIAGYTTSFGAGDSDFYIMKLDHNASLKWTRTIGGTGSDYVLSFIQTTDSGYAVFGETTSFGAGNYDMYIVKLEGNGAVQWTKTIGGTGNDYGESIIQTADGGYGVAGYTYSYGAGDYDMHFAKLDASGSFQWLKTIGGIGYDYALSVVQTTDGGYALFGSTSSFGAGYNDFYIAKLNSNGLLQWTKTIGGAGGDFGSYIIHTTDGGYALAGISVSFGAENNLDIYIVKLDGNGSLQWTRTIGGSEYEYVYSIIQTADGGYAVSGSTASFGAGEYDMYIVKLNGSGSLQWTKTIGGAEDEAAYSIIQTSDDGFLVAGYTHSFGTGDADSYIVKLDANGNTCGNVSSPSPNTGSGGILGSPSSFISSSVPTITFPVSITSSGGIVTKICVVGIQPISSEIPENFQLSQNYPNPFNPTTNIKFQISKTAFAELKIFDILGKEVMILFNEILNPGTYKVNWDASNYPNGVYFYKLSAGNYTEIKKMVLIK